MHFIYACVLQALVASRLIECTHCRCTCCPCSVAVPLLCYPGLLVTSQLLELFNQNYHCPTALRLPSLDYENEQGEQVEMLIIGDPTQPGAIINDGGPCGARSQFLLLASLRMRVATADEYDGLSARVLSRSNRCRVV